MAINQPHLERRSTGYYWRRRVPAHARTRFKPEFFCLPLRTNVPRDAAALVRQLTGKTGLNILLCGFWAKRLFVFVMVRSEDIHWHVVP